MGPASTIIEICGGHDNVANWLSVDVSRVYRWTYAKARGGSDGYIPSQYHHVLLSRAQAEGKELKPEHFFQQSEVPVPARQRESGSPNHPRTKRWLSRVAQ